jgi:hypothetical protein
MTFLILEKTTKITTADQSDNEFFIEANYYIKKDSKLLFSYDYNFFVSTSKEKKNILI